MCAPDGGSSHAVIAGVQDGRVVSSAHRLPFVGQVILQGQLQVTVHLEVPTHLTNGGRGGGIARRLVVLMTRVTSVCVCGEHPRAVL